MRVQLINMTPNPVVTIYKAYRICYSKDSYNTIEIPSYTEMCNFINNKIDKGHLSPLEHVNLSFSIEGISRSTAQQLLRHRTASPSMQSQRYVDAKNFSFVKPDSIATNEVANALYNGFLMTVTKLYENLIYCGIPKEDARCVLPNATSTQIVFTMDLRNFRNFYGERQCIHAQGEIKELAYFMMNLITRSIPFADYNVMKCGKLCNECELRKVGLENDL